MISPCVTCPACGDTEVTAGSRFCDSCGSAMPMPEGILISVESCVRCGSNDFTVQGICEDCGTPKQDRRAQDDRTVIGCGLAGLTDRGIRHIRNDDAFAISGLGNGGAGTVIVISDGVSNSQNPDMASAAAVKIATSYLVNALKEGNQARASVREAIYAAHDIVCKVPFDRHADVDPPAATIVVATVIEGTQGKKQVVVGWLGDSRLYWLSRSGTGELLTRDHSWFNEVMDEGRMTEEQARADGMAHAITKCMGTTDYTAVTPCPEPSVEVFEIASDGWLLACTDGLWNYAETPTALVLAAAGKLNGNADEICEQFIKYAISRGGVDNITAVLVKMD